MISEYDVSTEDEANTVVENSASRPLASRKNSGKVPKKIHKAEREKLKRDHLNELFLELGQALDPARQNNGKASILGDATRLLRELLTQVECLKKENVALVTESRYVTVEKNELRDENAVLGTEIEKLQNQLQERMQSVHAWSSHDVAASIQLQQHNNSGGLSSMEEQRRAAMGSPMAGPPIFVLPQAYSEADVMQQGMFKPPPSRVMRPHARYPTPSDSWPSQLLERGIEQTSSRGETQLTLGPVTAGSREVSAAVAAAVSSHIQTG